MEQGVPLPELARQHGVPLRTARRWVRQYRQLGLVGLGPHGRSDRGQRRLPYGLQQVIEGMALRTPPLSAATIARQVRTVAVVQGWPAPSYSRVYDIIHHIDPALRTLAHQGAKVYREEFDLLYRREASRSNEIWQADHTLLDLWVRGDRGQPVRPWFTAILDDYSRALAAYRLDVAAPSAQGTSLALRQAIWRKTEPRWQVCGIPETFYTDNGSDFTSQHLEQVAADLKMELVFSTPGAPRGRGRIERFFETVNQLFLSTLPGYTPRGTLPPADPVLTLSELDAGLGRFLVEDYQQRIHSETGVAPQARWEAGSFLPRLPESLEQLDLLLLTVAKPRQVHQDGIHFQGLRYIDLNLAAYVGESVTIRYDPRDLAEIRVYHQNHLVCRPICQELAGQTITLKDIIRARNHRRRELREGIAVRARLTDALLPLPQPTPPQPDPVPDPPSSAPRLKHYYNE